MLAGPIIKSCGMADYRWKRCFRIGRPNKSQYPIDGIEIDESPDNQIGGADVAKRNVISGAQFHGAHQGCRC